MKCKKKNKINHSYSFHSKERQIRGEEWAKEDENTNHTGPA